MVNRRLVAVLMAVAVLAACSAKIVVVPIPSDSTLPADGVIYALPNTVVRVNVKVNQTEYRGAPYAKFAAIFAPGGTRACEDPACTKEKEKKFSLQEGATFETRGEPDPNNVFLVKFTSGGVIDQSLSMTWNETGLVSAATAEVTNRTSDIVISSIKLVAGLATRAFFGATGKNALGNDICQIEASLTDEAVLPILYKAKLESAPRLVENYCRISKEDRDKLIARTDPAKVADLKLLEDARTAHDEHVFPVIDRINKITRVETGQNVFDPAIILARLEAEIANRLTRLYLGTKTDKTWDGQLDTRPTGKQMSLAILRIHPTKGICTTTDAELAPLAKPIPDKWISVSCDGSNDVTLQLRYYPDANKQLFTKLTAVNQGDRSFRYRIPAQVRAELTYSTKPHGAGVFSVAQLGQVISLPANLHSKKLSFDLGFIEATGALKTFKLGTSGGLEAGTIDALGGVTKDVLDARKKAHDAAALKEDELTILTREAALIKLRHEICEIQKKYGLTCTVQPQ